MYVWTDVHNLDGTLSASTIELRCETEPDVADLPKPLNVTFLLSPDILICNTFHFVRGQPLADKDMKGGSEHKDCRGGGFCPFLPLCCFSLPGEDRGDFGRKSETSDRRKGKLSVCMCVCLCVSVSMLGGGVGLGICPAALQGEWQGP